jgi:hypothetical protein
MQTSNRKPAKLRPELSVAQAELAAQFSDYAFDYPGLTFDDVARKVLGSRPFPNTPAGRRFKREAKEVFEQERKA